MGWAKFDDQFTDHPKVVAAGPWAELLAMRAVIYCARYETDGFIQAEQLPRLALGITSPKKQVAALLRVGLWEDAVGGWRVHDFLDYHPSKADKDEEREKARERMAKNRAKKDPGSDERAEDVRANVGRDTGRTSGYPDPTPAPEEPTLAAATPLRPRDEVFEAVIEACGLDLAELTKSARGAANKAAKELREVGATPEGIQARADVHRQRWPNAECTPSSLAKNYAQLGATRGGDDDEFVGGVRRVR